MSSLELAALEPSEVRVGLGAEYTRDVTEADVLAFAQLSGDENPLHTDAEYARTTNYAACIVHGAFQVSLASALLGMRLPGKRVVLTSVRGRFPAPLFHPCRVQVRGEVVAWSEDAESGLLRVRVTELQSSILTAEIHMGFGFHDRRAPHARDATAPAAVSGRELVIVTGASGGLGSELVRHLGQRFDVLALSRRAAAQGASGAVRAMSCDLEDAAWEDPLRDALAGRPAYAVVHAAWPGAPRGGLLDLDLDVTRRQLDFGGLLTVRLARWLAANARERGRLVLLGSTAGTRSPELSMAAYSLGKATLEHALRLLEPELAGRGITVNAVLPSYMAVGINQSRPDRATLLETARVPAGRLCATGDVLGAVDYLLSPAAGFVTGQLLPLTGGRL
jgi:NAD(P)-dependent dehydrogenase (short-subunit alcohol dehydrogenase family)/acyl dehydratase